MISEGEIKKLLEEAENRIAELEQFRKDSMMLNLDVIENEFLLIKRFYEERVVIFKMILGVDCLPF